MKKLLIIIICIVSSSLQAQEYSVLIPYYEVVDYTQNAIQIPGKDSSRINGFFRKIDSLLVFGAGKINILHIGGSHVQADMFSNQVRRNLDAINQSFQPSRGFVFPFNVAKTNNPTNYIVKYKGEWNAARNVQRNRKIPLGVGGIAVYTSDSDAEITVHLNSDEFDRRWNFDQLKLIGYVEDGTQMVTPVLRYNDETFIEPDFDADSQVYVYDLPELSDSFTINFRQEDSIPHTFIVNGFLPEKDEEGIVYHAIGVNGASVPSYLECERFEEELKLIAPDLVIFGIGINDATGKDFTEEAFISNYNYLLDMIRRVSPDCALVFITNNDSFKRISRRKYAVNRNGLTAQKAFYRIAEQNRGAVWDLFSIMGGLNSMQKWQKAGLARPDKVHFTREGYHLIGNLFYNALMDYYLKQNEIE